jgi:hypothetical protein
VGGGIAHRVRSDRAVSEGGCSGRNGELRVRVGVRPQGGFLIGVSGLVVGCAAHHASRARLIHVAGHAAQRAAAAAQAQPIVLHGPGTTHRSSGCAVLGPGKYVRASGRPIWPGPKLQD